MKSIALILLLFMIPLTANLQNINRFNIINSKPIISNHTNKYPYNMRHNNNPFNIRTNPNNKWVGKVPDNTEPFEVFTELDYGIRAGFKLLQNYNTKYGINTIEKIVHRFAPPFENDTHNYIKTVCNMTGYNSTEELDLTDKDTLLKLTAAIIYVEQGVYINPLEKTYNRFFE